MGQCEPSTAFSSQDFIYRFSGRFCGAGSKNVRTFEKSGDSRLVSALVRWPSMCSCVRQHHRMKRLFQLFCGGASNQDLDKGKKRDYEK